MAWSKAVHHFRPPIDFGYRVSPNDLTSAVMSGRRHGFLRLCLVLLPAVAVSCRSPAKPCKYEVQLETGDEENAGTDDSIHFKIRKDGNWHSLNNDYQDDFERGHVNSFTFEDDCIEKQGCNTEATIASEGSAKILYCFSDKWLLTKVVLKTLGRQKSESWECVWKLHKWFWCGDDETLRQEKE